MYRKMLLSDVAKTQRQLATGFRVNRAEDDPAGWSIGKKLNARIVGLTQALDNVGDTKSMLDIAEISLNAINDQLIAIKRLATQAANEGVYDETSREFIKNAINNRAAAIQDILNQATYNGINLLDSTFSGTFQVGAGVDDELSFAIDEMLQPEDTRVSEVTSEAVFTSAGAINAGTLLNSLDQYSGLQAGDTFDVVVTADDGTQSTVTVTVPGAKGAAATTTIQDILDAINGIGNFNAFLDGSGNIDVEEIVPTDGNLLAVEITNFEEADNLDGATGSLPFTFQASTGGFVTQFTAAGAIGGGTLLNDLDQFEDAEGGDVITVNLQARDGTTQAVSYTLPGGTGNATTATVSSLAAAITAQGGGRFQATVTGGQMLVEEINLAQGSFTVSSSFTEFSAGDAVVPSPPFTFAFSSGTMETTLLDNLLNPANAGTALNDLNGFGNLHGGDVISITVTNRSGVSQAFNFTLNDVADGVLSNRTLGELVTLLDGQTVGATTINATLDGTGTLSIEEDNPAQGSFSVSGSFTETSIDIIPKTFTNAEFRISDFLPLTSATGLVIGFGYENFNATFELDDEIARFLIRNVDDSISRVAGILNEIGVFQSRLTNRERYLMDSIVANSAAKSRILDTDYAKATAKSITQSILLQAQNAALVQANFAPRAVLGFFQ
jgi:flagellin-like hook-associated protein FlgL